MRWLLTILVALIILLGAVPWLGKFGLGRLPGDINFTIGRHHICIPIASTILIVLVAVVIGKLL